MLRKIAEKLCRTIDTPLKSRRQYDLWLRYTLAASRWDNHLQGRFFFWLSWFREVTDSRFGGLPMSMDFRLDIGNLAKSKQEDSFAYVLFAYSY